MNLLSKIAAVLSTLLLSQVVSGTTPLGDWTAGTASFFGGPQGDAANSYKLTLDSGSCGFGDFDPRLYPNYNVVGIHPTNTLVQDRPQFACGSCLEIECTSGPTICSKGVKPVQVVITDQCDKDCNATNINMHVLSFEELAPLTFGRIAIRYRLIDCEPADPITVHIANYRATLGGWIRLSLNNVGGDAGITSVELGASGSNVNAAAGEAGWQLMDNTFGGAWEASKLPQPPMDLRIENSILQTVVIKGAIPTAGLTGDVETTAQFPIPNAQTTASAAAAPTIIVGQALDKPANSTANATAALIDPAAAVAAASAVVGPANTASGAAPAGAAVANVPTAPSSTAAVVPPEAAGAAQGGAPNPLTAAANADAGAADADMVTIDAHPAASSLPLSAAVSHKAAAGARRMLLQRK